MSETGLYVLTRALMGGVTALLSGPVGTIDIPKADLVSKLEGNGFGVVAEVRGAAGLPRYVALSDGRIAPIEGLSQTFVDAVLAAEDTRFGTHPGIDPAALASASLDSLRGHLRGGSTLTQQLIKNAVVGTEHSLQRKLIEATLAVRLTLVMPADRIFESYLAHSRFGRGGAGAVDVARQWFGKRWADLNLAEAALLAGLLKGPSYYNPTVHPERARLRRDTVLQRMRDEGFIDAGTYAIAVAAPVDVVPADRYDWRNDTWPAKAIAHDLGTLATRHIPESDFDEIWLETSISPAWQDIAEEALVRQLAAYGGVGPVGRITVPDRDDPAYEPLIRGRAAEHVGVSTLIGRATDVGAEVGAEDGGRRFLLDRGFGPLEPHVFSGTQIPFSNPRLGDVWTYERVDGVPTLRARPVLDGAVVIMEPETGAILASVGSGLPADVTEFDRTRANRQPGSAVKPFLWISALEAGFLPDSIVDDTERTYYSFEGQDWSPRNYDHSQSGLIPLYTALEKSSNNVAAQLINDLGVYSMANIAEAAGVYPDGMPGNRTAALGAMETTLVNLVAGYAGILNGGFEVKPKSITAMGLGGRILWRQKKAYYRFAWPSSTSPVLAMLRGVILRGTAAGVFPSDLHIVGKTGTSSDHRDAWFVGGNPDIVIGVWVGRDDDASLPGRATGAKAAAPVVKTIFQTAIAQGLLNANGRTHHAVLFDNWPPVPFDTWLYKEWDPAGASEFTPVQPQRGRIRANGSTRKPTQKWEDSAADRR